jgi:hypothetical protein
MQSASFLRTFFPIPFARFSCTEDSLTDPETGNVPGFSGDDHVCLA